MNQLFKKWNEYCNDYNWWGEESLNKNVIYPTFEDFMNWYEQKYVEK